MLDFGCCFIPSSLWILPETSVLRRFPDQKRPPLFLYVFVCPFFFAIILIWALGFSIASPFLYDHSDIMVNTTLHSGVILSTLNISFHDLN